MGRSTSRGFTWGGVSDEGVHEENNWQRVHEEENYQQGMQGEEIHMRRGKHG